MSLRNALCIGLVSGHIIGLFGVPLVVGAMRIAPVKTAAVTEVGVAEPIGLTLEPDIAQPTMLLPLAISELLVDPIAPQTDAADEYVELFNPNDQAMDITGYVLKTSSNNYKLPATTVEAGDYVVIKSAVSHLALVNTGGSVMLADALGGPIMSVAWAQSVAGASWAHFNDDWHWTGTTTPGALNNLKLVGAEAAAAAVLPSVTPALVPAGSVLPSNVIPANTPGLGGADAATAITPPIITELLPDPIAPATDADAEFIELYNPSGEPFNLSGYTLKTGKTFSDHYTFGALIIEPGQYFSLTSAVSHLGLTNAGSNVALFDSSGFQVGATVSYDAAKPGHSWALNGDTWAWSTTPTPGTINLITSPAAPVTVAAMAAAKVAAAKKIAASTNKTTATKASAAPKAKTAPKATAASKPKSAPKAKADKAAKTSKTSKPLVAGASNGGGRWLLFVLVGLTIGYIIYEFRHDLQNFYHQFRSNPSFGGKTSQTPPRRGNDRVIERLGRRQNDLRPGAGARAVIQW